MFHAGSQLVLETSIAGEGDVIVVVVGLPIGVAGTTNLLRVITLPEPLVDQDKARVWGAHMGSREHPAATTPVSVFAPRFPPPAGGGPPHRHQSVDRRNRRR